MSFASGSSVTVIVKVSACGHLSKASTCQRGKRKRLETMAGRNAVRNTIGASHRESGRALFRGCFGTTAATCRPCAIAGRAVEAHHHQHPGPGPTLSSSVIQYSDGKQSVPNECVLITCASLYVFCNEFQVKMYNIITAFSGPPGLRPDHQILRAGGPVVHCFKMLISSPATPTSLTDLHFHP